MDAWNAKPKALSMKELLKREAKYASDMWSCKIYLEELSYFLYKENIDLSQALRICIKDFLS